MIYLISGPIASGKSLFSYLQVLALQNFNPRPVFSNDEILLGCGNSPLPMFFGSLTLDYDVIFEDLPLNTILVLDEATQFNCVLLECPSFINALQHHRHLGLDIIIITQNPVVLSRPLKSLIGDHSHLRKFRPNRSSQYYWKAGFFFTNRLHGTYKRPRTRFYFSPWAKRHFGFILSAFGDV